MSLSVNRRRFLATTAATAAGMGFVASCRLQAETGDEPAPGESSLKPGWLPGAVIGDPKPKMLAELKKAGFQGIEAGGKRVLALSRVDAAKEHLEAEKLGLRIHSVLFGWANFNSPNSGQIAQEIEKITAAIEAAQGLGADTLLLVPCKIVADKNMPLPAAREFDIEFDEKSGHLRRVVSGDNKPYAKYIEAHNASVDGSKKAIAKLIPAAARSGVTLAIENVWNNFCVTPDLFANFVASFKSPWVKAYLDLGNHVKYSPTEQWIQALGSLVVKCHVKDYRLSVAGQDDGFVNIREGSVNWPSVRRELAAVNYQGWMTIEGSGRLPLAEKRKRLDLILEGK